MHFACSVEMSCILRTSPSEHTVYTSLGRLVSCAGPSIFARAVTNLVIYKYFFMLEELSTLSIERTFKHC
jgi:hypothetical protein